ncbi:small conductance mechanosensitive channel [Caulobacter ginsengisoli]|uniref:Small-conductance mechanosensitive channel n=1 Tax=Caulobacter ginsengisoli TaxID=400775 RepID=A0ABU0IRK2_9CAUL|nr:mechanosensitive ion channel domain-containing protein [Caulobacter ginsengisoli]MDQ0464645.1 small conductance mechanosensitive channel [Caulobacter ginsengisoli]
MPSIDLSAVSRLIPHADTRGLVAAGFIDKASQFGVDLLVAGIILVGTFWAAGWSSSLVRGGFNRLNARHPTDPTVTGFFSSLVRYVVIIIGLVAVLQQLGVKTASILAVLGAASLAIGLALQGALANMAAGIMILLFRPYRVGDTIESAGKKGTVRALDLFFTELATDSNLKVLIPNGKVFGDVIVNHSAHGRVRLDLLFKLPVDTDLPPLMKGLIGRFEADERIDKTPEPRLEVTGMDKDNVELTAKLWAGRQDKTALSADVMLAVRELAAAKPEIRPEPVPDRPEGHRNPRSRRTA